MENISDKTVGKLVSLAILAVGLAVGFAGGVMYRPQQEVQAQASGVQSPNVQEVSPGMTTGTLGVNLLLAHEVAADRIIVNGYDLLKMQSNILGYLASRPSAETADIQNIVRRSQADTIYKIKQPAPAPPPPEKKP